MQPPPPPKYISFFRNYQVINPKFCLPNVSEARRAVEGFEAKLADLLNEVDQRGGTSWHAGGGRKTAVRFAPSSGLRGRQAHCQAYWLWGPGEASKFTYIYGFPEHAKDKAWRPLSLTYSRLISKKGLIWSMLIGGFYQLSPGHPKAFRHAFPEISTEEAGETTC